MNSETQTIEYKSLQKIRTGDKGFRELSTTCVALANAQGGQIYVGYDDKNLISALTVSVLNLLHPAKTKKAEMFGVMMI